MAQFPKNYFEDEEKEGFLVESMMKRAWAAQIEVLEMIDRICVKYGLKYYADWGTLLGTVRHKGFIPWDDDIDIAMERKDYMKFIEVSKTELPKQCKLLSIYTEMEYGELFARVVNSDSINFEEAHLEHYHGCPYVVGVDIFPLDELPEDADVQQAQYEILNLFLMAVKMCKQSEVPENVLLSIENFIQQKLDREKNLLNQLLRQMDQICQFYNGQDSSKLAEFANYVINPAWIMKKEWYQERLWLPFETIQIAVPRDSDAVLKCMYGDYRKIIRGGADHTYPFYKEQQQMVEERLKQMY